MVNESADITARSATARGELMAEKNAFSPGVAKYWPKLPLNGGYERSATSHPSVVGSAEKMPFLIQRDETTYPLHARPTSTEKTIVYETLWKSRYIHCVVRTPNGNDYGKDLLRQHYQSHAHA